MSISPARAVAAALGLVAALSCPAGAQNAPPSIVLAKVAEFDHQVTGVTVSRDGRIFVNFPRWTEDSPVSVAELKDGKPLAFPDESWNG